jgi:hypothetical protein
MCSGKDVIENFPNSDGFALVRNDMSRSTWVWIFVALKTEGSLCPETVIENGKFSSHYLVEEGRNASATYRN